MNIVTQIIEEVARFETFYGTRPTRVYIGAKQAREIDEVIADMRNLGLLVKEAQPLPRTRINGFPVFRVDADSHLEFGLEQPSPCG